MVSFCKGRQIVSHFQFSLKVSDSFNVNDYISTVDYSDNKVIASKMDLPYLP